jgi:very-short-patch-repair endonuclease
MSKPPKTILSFRRQTARRLRASETNAEARLWKHLRQAPMLGSHFRRQVPIGPYIADLACMAAKLIIEVDGSQHGEPANAAKDSARTRWLEAEGYRVLRFWNNDVTSNIEGVLDAVADAMPSMLGDIPLKHNRRPKKLTPPRRATRADPPPPGEGEGGAASSSLSKRG